MQQKCVILPFYGSLAVGAFNAYVYLLSINHSKLLLKSFVNELNMERSRNNGLVWRCKKNEYANFAMNQQ